MFSVSLLSCSALQCNIKAYDKLSVGTVLVAMSMHTANAELQVKACDTLGTLSILCESKQVRMDLDREFFISFSSRLKHCPCFGCQTKSGLCK